MIVTITSVMSLAGARYKVDIEGQPTTHIIHAKNLDWHLKNKMNLNQLQRDGVWSCLTAEGQVTLDLSYAEDVAS